MKNYTDIFLFASASQLGWPSWLWLQNKIRFVQLLGKHPTSTSIKFSQACKHFPFKTIFFKPGDYSWVLKSKPLFPFIISQSLSVCLPSFSPSTDTFDTEPLHRKLYLFVLCAASHAVCLSAAELLCWHFDLIRLRCTQLVWGTELGVCEDWKTQQQHTHTQVSAAPSDNLISQAHSTWWILLDVKNISLCFSFNYTFFLETKI